MGQIDPNKWGKTPNLVKTDMVCYERLLYMVGFLRPPATTSRLTTIPTSYRNSTIQDGMSLLEKVTDHSDVKV